MESAGNVLGLLNSFDSNNQGSLIKWPDGEVIERGRDAKQTLTKPLAYRRAKLWADRVPGFAAFRAVENG
jgi:hypothetical protein